MRLRLSGARASRFDVLRLRLERRVVMTDDSFSRVLEGLRCGEESAATKVFERFAQRLIALARQRLDRRVRQRIDAEDVLQSVFRSFFQRHAAGQFELQGWDSLWSLLVVLTVRKCGRKRRQEHAARRDVARDAPADDVDSWQAIDREPTPEEAAQLSELVEHLMRGASHREQRILMLRLQGHSISEISEQIARTERTVLRVLQQFRKRLESMLGTDASRG
jgi:RNA polymerase sigma-70 factor (ECF subfamily)